MAEELWNGPVVLQSFNYPKHLVGFGQDGAVTLRSDGKRFELISPGLTGEHGTISFKSFDKDDFYLRHFDSELYCEYSYDNRNTSSFAEDATFRVYKDKWYRGTFSFESVNVPGQYIRHCDWRLRLGDESEGEVLQKDASFRLVEGPFRIQSKNYPENFMCLDDNEGYMNNEGCDFFIMRPGMLGGGSSVSLNPACDEYDRIMRHYCSELNADCIEDCGNSESLPDDSSFHIQEDRFAPGYFAMESQNFPNHFVRHADSRVRIDEDNGEELMHEDASFRFVKGPVTITSYNYPEQGIGFNEDKKGYLMEGNQRFWLMPGLNHTPGSVSMESVDHPNHFLRHYDSKVDLEDRFEGRNVASLVEDASFKMKEDVWFENTVVFESVNFPGQYLRHQCSRLKIQPYEQDDLFHKDASFRITLEK